MHLDRPACWDRLAAHRAATREVTLRQLFAADPGRYLRLSARLDDLVLDYSKCQVTSETVALLAELVRACDVAGRRDAMLAGQPINASEGRAVLHTALRNRSARPVLDGGRDVMPEVRAALARLKAFAHDIRSGLIKGARGGSFTDVISIGIGGSDLGPAMATAALRPWHSGPRVHFVSNVDGAHLADTIAGLDPARTLILVASKSFTTVETMTNARSARAWIAAALGEATVAAHFVALSTAAREVDAFGIPPERMFGFWDWVGGRYSVWSAIGLPLMLAIGPDAFDRFLDGAFAMDEHFRSAPFEANLPMLLGALGVWHRSICGYPTRAILPYDQRLSRLPAHLQQIEMESNGKRVTLEGAELERPASPVVWGAPGTDAQHSFFQQLHQGVDVVPCELLIAAEGHEPGLAHHHALLIANCLAQSEALALGRTGEEARAQMIAEGLGAADADRLAPHKTFPGNRPSITLAYRRLDPFTLGRLVALYEHRVLVEAAIHGINAFDQWGVELGKEVATSLLPAVAGRADAATLANPSTRGLVQHLRALQGS